jgi:hypothetical protein
MADTTAASNSSHTAQPTITCKYPGGPDIVLHPVTETDYSPNTFWLDPRGKEYPPLDDDCYRNMVHLIPSQPPTNSDLRSSQGTYYKITGTGTNFGLLPLVPPTETSTKDGSKRGHIDISTEDRNEDLEMMDTQPFGNSRITMEDAGQGITKKAKKAG